MKLIREIRAMTAGRDWRGRSRTPRSAVEHEQPARPAEFPTGWARTGPAQAARRAVQRGVLTPLVWQLTRPEVRGRDHLAGLRGPVVLVANHASHLDAPLILGSLPAALARRVAVGAAADYFFDARWRAGVTALVFNAFPVHRYSSGRQRSLAPDLLARGWSLLLFPEGTRSEDGWMGRLRLGAGQLCVSRRVPAVPVVLRGTFAAMPRGRNWPVPGRPRVVVSYGPPLLPEPGEAVRAFNDRLGTALARLWAEEEVGWYGALRKQARGELALPTGPSANSWRRVWESTRPAAPPSRPGVQA